MPRNDLFDDARKRLGGLFSGAQEATEKEIDPAKLSEAAKMQLARQGRAERSGVSKPKGIAGGLRGDVTQALGKAAGVISQQNRVVTANPQQRKGMRFDPRSRGGQSRASSVQPAIPQNIITSAAPQRNTVPGSAGGVGGGKGHGASFAQMYGGGGMRGYSERGYDDSDISSANKAQDAADDRSKQFGTKTVFGGMLSQGLKAGTFGGLLTAMGAPAQLAARLAMKTFMMGMFGPAMAMGAIKNFYQGWQVDNAYKDVYGKTTDPNSPEARKFKAVAEKEGMDRQESTDFFKTIQEAEEKGITDSDQKMNYVDQEKPTSPQSDFEGMINDISPPTTQQDNEAINKEIGIPTSKPVDQWSYNPDNPDAINPNTGRPGMPGGSSGGDGGYSGSGTLGSYGAPDTGGAYGGGYEGIGDPMSGYSGFGSGNSGGGGGGYGGSTGGGQGM